MDATQNLTADRGPMILGSCVSCISLALLIMAIRMWVKVSIVKHIGPDDWVCLSAAVVMLVQMILIIVQVDLGAGRHRGALTPENNVKGLHINFVTQPLCLIGLALVKISIGLLLLRLTTSKKFIRFIWAAIIFTILSFTANFLVVMLQCRPLAFTWGGTTEGKCIASSDLKFAAFFNSSVSVLTDVIFAILPAVLLWRVQLNRRTKIATIPVLSLGVLACAAGITKMFYLDSYGKYGDFLWDSSYITVWTTVEICVAIIAASAYALKPLFQALLKDRTAKGSGPGNSNGYSSRLSRKFANKVDSKNSSQRIRMKPDYNDDLEMGSQPSKQPFSSTSQGSSGHSQSHNSSYHHEESLITKTTDLAVFVSDRRPSDDTRLEKDDGFEYDSRHH